jgi:hypothetical protein
MGELIIHGPVPPSDGGCHICWKGPRKGLMVYDRSVGGNFVHQECLDWWGVDSCAQWERQYLDIQGYSDE